MNALEHFPTVPDKVRSLDGCKSKIVHVLDTLVSLDIWVPVLRHEAWNSRQRSAKALCKSFVSKCSNNSLKIWMQAFSLTVDPSSANSDKPGSNQLCRIEISLPSVVLHLSECLLDDYFWCNHLHIECSFCWDPPEILDFRWVSSAQIWDLQIWKKGKKK